MSGPSGIHRVGTAEDLESSLAFARAKGFTIDIDTGQAMVDEPQPGEPEEIQEVVEQAAEVEPDPIYEQPLESPAPKPTSAEEAWRMREQRRREAALQDEYRRNLQQQAPPAAAAVAAAPEEEVDILEDPDRFLSRRLSPLEQEVAGLRQVAQALIMDRSREQYLARVAAERNEELSLLRSLEEEFKANEAPDYDEVFEAWVNQQETWARSTFNLTPDAARQYVAARAAEVVNAAKFQGVNPAKAMYTMIKPQGSTPAPAPKPATKPTSQAIAKAKSQQKHAAPAAASTTAAGFSSPAAMARAGMTRAQARELMEQGGRKALLRAAVEATRG